MKREPAVLLILAVIITFTAASCCLFGSGKTDDSRTITPSAYRMAVINFELQDTAGGSATIITVPSSNPVILNLTPGATLTASETTLETVLNDNVGAMTTGRTYDEYIITPLYIEMEFETAFHVPSIADEYGFSIDGSSLDTVRTSLVRFYYNPIDNIWRRDMVIYLENIGDGDVDPLTYPDGWYWMRRALEGSTDDFLIPVSTTHPGTPGYADLYPGYEGTLDQFNNDAFWGMDDYDDASVETVIDSDTDPGGMNASWDDFTYTTGDTISCTPDITNTMNFAYETDASKVAATMATDLDVIDYGPGYNNSGVEELYGDWGFHPFMPSFTNDSTAP